MPLIRAETWQGRTQMENRHTDKGCTEIVQQKANMRSKWEDDRRTFSYLARLREAVYLATSARMARKLVRRVNQVEADLGLSLTKYHGVESDRAPPCAN